VLPARLRPFGAAAATGSAAIARSRRALSRYKPDCATAPASLVFAGGPILRPLEQIVPRFWCGKARSDAVGLSDADLRATISAGGRGLGWGEGASPGGVGRLAQPRRYRRKAGDVDAVTGGFGDEGKRVGALAHAAQRP
jgi:hypothetical protein